MRAPSPLMLLGVLLCIIVLVVLNAQDALFVTLAPHNKAVTGVTLLAGVAGFAIGRASRRTS